jgi:hypothetical protein
MVTIHGATDTVVHVPYSYRIPPGNKIVHEVKRNRVQLRRQWTLCAALPSAGVAEITNG